MDIWSEKGDPFGLAVFRCVIVAALVLLMCCGAWGQATATLLGVVTDATGAPVPKATVLLHEENTGVDRTTKTDASGSYVVPGLLPGLFQVTVSASGFQAYVIKDLRLDVASTVTQNVQLKIGQVTEQVVVNGGPPMVDTSTTAVGDVVTPDVVQEIPLNGRHFLDLAIITPGTMTPNANGFLVAPLQGLGSLSVDTAGQRETTLNLLVNGVNLNDEVQNQVTFQPSIDTVSEFKIDNSTFPAEYGRNSGAIVSIATKSGTNQYHGEAFDFLRNNFFDARNYFNPTTQPQSPLNRNDFGGDVGGPIQKNKMFFFLSYEGLRQLHALTLDTPVPAMGTTSTNTTVNNLLALLPPQNGTINTSTGPIPAFLGSTNAPVNEDIGTADFSANLTSKDEFHGYYAIEKDHRFEPTSAADLPNFGDTRNGSRQLLTLAETHNFNPELTNQVRLGFNRLFITFEPNDSNLSSATIGIGLPPGVPDVGIPLIVIQNPGFELGNPTGEPQGRGDTNVVFNDTATWLKGRHSVSFGVDVSRFYNNNLGENVGEFVFSSLTNFLNDAPSSFSTLEGNSDDKVLQPASGVFVEDSFKWRPNITFNFGLRYDWNSTPSEANDKFSVFDPTTDALVTNGQPFRTNNKNVQPRVGVAWDPWGDGRTSVRASYAILTQQPTTNLVSGLSGNPPFATPIADSTAVNGAFTLEAPPASLKSVAPFTVDPNYHDLYTQDWNLTVQRALTDTMSLQVAYVGSKSTHLQQVLNLNQPLVVGGVFEPAADAPFPNFTEIEYVTGNGNSNYNGLWVTFTKRVTHGFEFEASYTYSKSLDYSSLDVPNFLPQDSNNLRAEYGPSDFDARNRLVFSGYYTLPFKGNRLVEGWQFAVVSQAQSGNPLTAYLGGVSGLFAGATVRPNVTGPIGITGNPAQWFTDKTVFALQCTGTPPCSPGNEGRNMFVGPDFVDTDISLIKATKITERIGSEFRAEAFDIFNHPSFGDPNLTVGSSSFGVITSTRFPTGDFGSSRQLQFALKLTF
jgi:outer membrane receptor protein involved in Fe transport